MRKILYSLALLPLIFIAACTTSQVEKTIPSIKQSTVSEQTSEGESGLTLLAGTTSQYYRFDKAHYEKSIEDGKIIFLDFHANWCPICARENPKILAAFNELNNPDVVGYQVHFNDRETTDDDEEMAKKYGIVSQYTKVFLDKEGNIALKTLEILDKDRIINEINKAVGG